MIEPRRWWQTKPQRAGNQKSTTQQNTTSKPRSSQLHQGSFVGSILSKLVGEIERFAIFGNKTARKTQIRNFCFMTFLWIMSGDQLLLIFGEPESQHDKTDRHSLGLGHAADSWGQGESWRCWCKRDTDEASECAEGWKSKKAWSAAASFFPGIFQMFDTKNGHTKPETSCEMVLKV